MSFTQRILLSMLAGIVVGVALNASAAAVPALNSFLVDGLFYVVGGIFLALLRLMVVPLVLVSLVCGVNAMGDLRTFGRVGAKTVSLFLATTAVAVTVGLSMGLVVSPGSGFELEGDFAEVSPREMPPLVDTFINIFPENLFLAMADGQMLQIIVFALLFGFAANLAGERANSVVRFFRDLNEVILKMVMLIIELAPIGLFALLARTFATQGLDILIPLAGYFLLLAGTLLLYLLVAYPLVLRAFGLNAVRFLTGMRAPMTFAFSTASSAATIPVTLNALSTATARVSGQGRRARAPGPEVIPVSRHERVGIKARVLPGALRPPFEPGKRGTLVRHRVVGDRSLAREARRVVEGVVVRKWRLAVERWVDPGQVRAVEVVLHGELPVRRDVELERRVRCGGPEPRLVSQSPRGARSAPRAARCIPRTARRHRKG